MRLRPIQLILLLFFIPSLGAQISFTNANYLLPGQTFNSGVGLGVSDMNNDGLSDIIHLDQGRNLFISYQQPGQSFNTVEYLSMANSSQWAMTVADITNNGFGDVFSGGVYDDIKIAVSDDQGMSFDLTTMPGNSIFVQGSNFVDINNDGLVDVFSCHDDAMSKIYQNNGDGSFTEVFWIDMTTVPASDNSGNYGSVWTDFDNDGDIDLYIAKCRQGVNDPSDPRRINALFVNDGNNNFTEMAEEYGLKIGAQSWTADFGDMDNDGDLDCFITNHDTNSQVLENDGTGHFTDISNSTGIDIGGLPIQGMWEDFDNDGYLDIIVAGSQHSIWKNNGDHTFTEVTVFDNNDMESFAIGDLNSDGFIDVMGGYANIYTSPSNIQDVLWLNDGNDNNYLSVNLEGIISNRSAIGARIEIHGDWGVQVREVRAGESYGIHNDFQQVFGIGQSESVDSLVIKWPSGIITTLQDVEANQTLNLLEQDCEPLQVTLSTSSADLVLCPGESITIEANELFDSYTWNNGETTAAITVTEAGIYYVQVEDDNNCIGISSSILVESPEPLSPVISTEGATSVCLGTTVELTYSNPTDNFQWSTGQMDEIISVNLSGSYYLTAINECNEAFNSNTIDIEFIEVETPVVDNDTINTLGTYTFESNSENTNWYDANPPTGAPLFTGQIYVTEEFNTDQTFYAEQFIDQSVNLIGGASEHNGTNLYSGGQYNGILYFDCYEAFTLNSVEVYADQIGPRRIQLKDENNNVLAEYQVTIMQAGWMTVPLNFMVQPGTNYQLTTDQDFNNNNFGDNSPFFIRSNQGVSYPYEIGDVAAITTSNYGDPYYYYFYNWNVSSGSEPCYSELVEVQGVYDPNSSIQNLDPLVELTVYPNPVVDEIRLEGIALEDFEQAHIIDVLGHRISVPLMKGNTITVHSLSAGMYQVELIQGNLKYTGKFIKQ